jgi:CheY-like chemotaxis protein
MVVDDSPDLINTFKTGLQQYGFKVDAFESPLKALENFKKSIEGTYHILLIDIKMEEMNGFDLYEEIKETGKIIPPVCFITAFQEFYDGIKPSFPELSMNCFIRKPIEIIDLAVQLKQKINNVF